MIGAPRQHLENEPPTEQVADRPQDLDGLGRRLDTDSVAGDNGYTHLSNYPIRSMAPPLTFRRSDDIGTSRRTASTCGANASFSSIRSKSSAARPVRSCSFRMAGTGPMPIARGSTPA